MLDGCESVGGVACSGSGSTDVWRSVGLTSTSVDWREDTKMILRVEVWEGPEHLSGENLEWRRRGRKWRCGGIIISEDVQCTLGRPSNI